MHFAHALVTHNILKRLKRQLRARRIPATLLQRRGRGVERRDGLDPEIDRANGTEEHGDTSIGAIGGKVRGKISDNGIDATFGAGGCWKSACRAVTRMRNRGAPHWAHATVLLASHAVYTGDGHISLVNNYKQFRRRDCGCFFVSRTGEGANAGDLEAVGVGDGNETVGADSGQGSRRRHRDDQ